ncbi:MAG: hypothetical protein M3P48_08910, partial [Actinomycetota bacterium]|nr:hypothetical protein [Actinomycetota bacterium]
SPRGGELRIRLEQLLGHHSVLTDRLARARLRGDVDFAQSADAALVKNTEDMRDLVASLYGEKAGERFADVWASHVRYVATYAGALREGDRQEMRRARRGLENYVRSLSRFFSRATDGAAPAATLRAGLRMHTRHLLEQADAYHAEDYERAYSLGRQGYRHTFVMGKQLASAMTRGAGKPLPRDFESPQRELQSTLGLLLGEHVELAVDTMRAGVGNWPDFDAAAAGLNGNTGDLTAAIESVFGERSADEFLSLWSDHIDTFMAYTQAVAAEDDAAKDAATRRFARFNQRFSAFLRNATEGRLTSPSLATEFHKHEELLLAQIDDYASADYEGAHDLTFEAYQHMFALADATATAIGGTAAARRPRGGAQTGGERAGLFDVWRG